MATDIIMPQGGQDITEGLVVRWFKKEGDPLQRGEVICEVETEKAVFEVEAPVDGVLLKIVAPAGTKVPVFAVIGIIGAPGEAIDSGRPGTAPAQAGHTPAGQPIDIAAIRRRAAGRAGGPEKTAASGRARRLASEKGVDLSGVTGSGPGGRIVEKDILLHVDKRKLSVEALRGRSTPLSPMRRTIARRMVQSKQTIPHFYATVSADATAALERRDQLQRETGADISVTDLILKATALALRAFPAMNCRLQGDQIVWLEDVNIGMAVMRDDGVMVPVLARVDRLGLEDIAHRSAEAAAAARAGRQAGREPACFTVSNLGMLGVDSFTAIINPPEAGILAAGRIEKRPVVENDEVCIRSMLTLTLSVDHRIVDGALAARFIARIRHHLENPITL
jgi:pyruvate dehydrogenase E2 component (dihydrolipoamide acetyltransferase)